MSMNSTEQTLPDESRVFCQNSSKDIKRQLKKGSIAIINGIATDKNIKQHGLL